MKQKLPLPFFVLMMVAGATAYTLAQVSLSYSFSPNTTIRSSEVNSNFSALSTKALDRTGGEITGNVTVATNITVDGADISDFLSGTTLTSPGVTVFGGQSLTWPASQTLGSFLTTNGSGALSWGLPYTGTLTRGAVLIGDSNPALAAVAVGAAGTSVRSDGTDTTFAYSGVATQSSTFSAAYGIDYYVVSATATANLPACDSGHLGKWFHFKFTSASGTLTLDGNASETVDGVTTYPFSTQYAAVSIVCGSAGAWSIF